VNAQLVSGKNPPASGCRIPGFPRSPPILLLLLALLPGLFPYAGADIVFPVQDFGFSIDGMDQYPEYYIIAYPVGEESSEKILAPGEYLDAGRGNPPGVFAVKKELYSSRAMESPELRRSFFLDPSSAVKSTGIPRFFSENSPEQENLTGVRETYRIVSLNDTMFELARTGRVFCYADGSEEPVWTGAPGHHVVNPFASGSAESAETPGTSPEKPASRDTGAGEETIPRSPVPALPPVLALATVVLIAVRGREP
jgi:hypothetical protein